MADIPVKISELEKAYSLSVSPVDFLINQQNDINILETKFLPLSVLMGYVKEEAKKEISNFIEVGTVIPYAGKVIGQESIKGWLLCNGQLVKKKNYEALWNLIGETYGPSTDELFCLPDLKARIEMGYSHTGESYEPDFGNWIPGDKIYLGEGNNPNYPDRGIFSCKLENENIQNHRHYATPHKHKILNYVNMADYNKRGNNRYGYAGENYYYESKHGLVASPSINWIVIAGLSPNSQSVENILFDTGGFGLGLIYSTNYSSVLNNRLNFKSYDSSRINAVKKYAANNPIRTVLVYKKEFVEEIKNRKKTPPTINSSFNSDTKVSFSSNVQGSGNYHSNIQPYATTNFLIKY